MPLMCLFLHRADDRPGCLGEPENAPSEVEVAEVAYDAEEAEG